MTQVPIENKRRRNPADSILNHIPAIIYRCAVDEKWTFLYTNQAARDTIGIDAINKGLSDLLLPEDREDVLASFRSSIDRHGMFSIAHRFINGSGSVGWVEDRGQASLDANGMVTHVDGILLDITQQKTNELSTDEHNKEVADLSRLLGVLNRVGMALILVDDTDVLFRNAVEHAVADLGFERMGIWVVDPEQPDMMQGTFGIDETGKLRDERMARQPLDRAVFYQYLVKATPPNLFFDVSILQDDHQAVVGYGEHVIAALWDGHTVNGYVSVDNLITRKSIDLPHREILQLYAQTIGHLYTLIKAQSALRRLNQDLESRVIERTAQLEASNREMQTFSYSISHDLRSPLRTIHSFSQILEEEYSGILDETGRDYLRRIRGASITMGDLMDALLKLAKVSQGGIRRTRVALDELAQQIADDLQLAQPERQVQWVIGPGLLCQADAILMRIVLDNLIGNAWKFTSAHSSAIIEFGQIEQDGQVVFFVRDDGVGFNMEYVDKLFGPFQRLHSGIEFEGSGIGLAIVQRIIHRHGGKIWAEAMLDQGTVFYFTVS